MAQKILLKLPEKSLQLFQQGEKVKEVERMCQNESIEFATMRVGDREILWPVLSKKRILETCEKRGAILEGHFVYSKGGHGRIYVDKSRITFFPGDTYVFCLEIARHWLEDDIDVVVGPAIGAIKIAEHVAGILGQVHEKDVPALYTEKDEEGKQVLKRGEYLMKGKNVLVVEDVSNTGGSVKETIDACTEAGGIVVGCHVFFDRSSGKVTAEMLGVRKFLSLMEISAENYKEDECPFCAERIPIDTRAGHWEKFFKDHPEAAN